MRMYVNQPCGIEILRIAITDLGVYLGIYGAYVGVDRAV